MQKRISFFTVIILFGLCLLYSNSQRSAWAKDITADEMPQINECNTYTPLKDALCIGEQLSKLDKYIVEIIKKTKKDIRSEWGDLANEEIAAKLDLSQKSWESYRDTQCSLNYYSKASSHSPSEDEKIARCKLSKTMERVLEIQNLQKNRS